MRIHPSHLINDEDRALLDVWSAYRRGEMGGVGYLPYEGGYAQQPSGLMRALDSMSSAYAIVRERYKAVPAKK